MKKNISKIISFFKKNYEDKNDINYTQIIDMWWLAHNWIMITVDEITISSEDESEQMWDENCPSCPAVYSSISIKNNWDFLPFKESIYFTNL